MSYGEQYAALSQEVTNSLFEKNYPNLTPPSIEVLTGRKYEKVVRREVTSLGGMSVEAFIDGEGNVYKPEGWSKPAKGVRFNIATEEGFQALKDAMKNPFGGHLYR